MVTSSKSRYFGLDESYRSVDQRRRSINRPADSPEKSESRLTTGDTGEICNFIFMLNCIHKIDFLHLQKNYTCVPFLL